MKRLFRILLLILIILKASDLSDHRVSAAELNGSASILILNSYSEDFEWTREEVEGILETLSESGLNNSISIEYMDWKKYRDPQNLEYLYEYYKYKYEEKKIDIIIATDDAALDFALEHRGEIFHDAPIVFCGINQEKANSVLKENDRVTGVIEEIDCIETIQTALKINPSIQKLYLIYDNSESGKSSANIVSEQVKEQFPEIAVISCNNMSFEELITTVQRINKNSMVLFTTYYRDGDGKVIDMDYALNHVSANSSVPVYGLQDFGLNKGIVGGTMLSGKLQGSNAAALAKRLINGEVPENIPLMVSTLTQTTYDYEQLKRYGISMKDLPDNATIINKPFSFFETYKTLVFMVIAILVILLLFISILLIYIKKIRRIRRNLAEKNEEITQLYEELTASDEEMRQQYDQILEINEKIRISEEKVSYLAYFDELTGLPNKITLYEHFKNKFQAEGRKTALLFIDIDNFKNVNDTLGHASGDALIKWVSEKLTALMKDHGSIYRLSGDEFIILFDQIEDVNEVTDVTAGLLSGFDQEYDIQGSNIHISLSIGIALYPDQGEDIEQLLKNADIAMYKVKESGRNNFMVYNEQLKADFLERINIEKHLKKAIDNHELEVYYQPQVDVRKNIITGFEALLRWHSPELGNVPPLKFIKVAEDTRMILPIGTWVMKNACAFMHKLELLGYNDLVASVNISVLQLLQADFCDTVFDILQECELASNSLELEITETVLIESYESVAAELKNLNDKNIRIALDDFGKGYSSLNYLMQLPISTLKVDKSFVDEILDQEENTLTGQIISLGKSLGMCVVAEGVEYKEQLEYLHKHGCDKIQGYLYSRPVPESEFVELLKHWK